MPVIAFADLDLHIRCKTAPWRDEKSIHVLKGVSGAIRPGGLTALMGASGCGKTTLLNVISSRMGTVPHTVAGSVTCDGVPLATSDVLRHRVAYVTQGDFLVPHFTVRESLTFAANMSLPSWLSGDEKLARIESVVSDLGLNDCLDTLIGDDMTVGCSGGEKRRVSIALQLLSDPAVLILDEPTTGLDSFTALNIVSTLHRLAAAHPDLIVIVSLHQPRADIFALFRDVLLMARGEVVFAGPRAFMGPFFDSVGLPCPVGFNLADHCIDVTAVETRTEHGETTSLARLTVLTQHWRRAGAREAAAHAALAVAAAAAPVATAAAAAAAAAAGGPTDARTGSFSLGRGAAGAAADADAARPRSALASPASRAARRLLLGRALSRRNSGLGLDAATADADADPDDGSVTGTGRGSVFTFVPVSPPAAAPAAAPALSAGHGPESPVPAPPGLAADGVRLDSFPSASARAAPTAAPAAAAADGQALIQWAPQLESVKRVARVSHLQIRSGTAPGLFAADEDEDLGRPSFCAQVVLLAGRFLKAVHRDRLTILGGFAQALGLTFWVGLVFMQLPGSLEAIRARTSLMYMACTVAPYVTLTAQIYIQIKELAVFDNERPQRRYSPAAYLTARLLTAGTTLCIASALGSLLVYLMTGLRLDPAISLARYVGINLISTLFVLALSSLCSAVFRSFALASLLANALFTFFCLGSGFFIQSDSLPVFIRWIRKASYIHYLFRALCSNEFTDRLFDCPLKDTDPGNPACDVYRGNFILKQLGIAPNDWTTPALIALAIAAGVYLAAVAVLTLWIPRAALSTGKVSDDVLESSKLIKTVLTARDFFDIPPAATADAADAGAAPAARALTLTPVRPSFGAAAAAAAVVRAPARGLAPFNPVDAAAVSALYDAGLRSPPLQPLLAALASGPAAAARPAAAAGARHRLPVTVTLDAYSIAVPAGKDAEAAAATAAERRAHWARSLPGALIGGAAGGSVSSSGATPTGSLMPSAEREERADDADLAALIAIAGGADSGILSTPSALERATARSALAQAGVAVAGENDDDVAGAGGARYAATDDRVSDDKLVLVRDVTATFRPGELWAVMGGSGSGKSTLLAGIAQRLTSGSYSHLGGGVRFNARAATPALADSLVGLVAQQDHLLPSLTVLETLRYAARLRLPSEVSAAELERRVTDVVVELGLRDCAHSIVGSDTVKGVSGGEKRRLSIAVQMLTDPSVVLLDEPTSGLDAFTAFNVMRTVKRVAHSGRTVVATVHQPRADVLRLFDNVMFLSKSRIVYCGPARALELYCSSLPPTLLAPCPPGLTLADWVLDATSVDTRTAAASGVSRQRVRAVARVFELRRRALEARDRARIDVVASARPLTATLLAPAPPHAIAVPAGVLLGPDAGPVAATPVSADAAPLVDAVGAELSPDAAARVRAAASWPTPALGAAVVADAVANGARGGVYDYKSVSAAAALRARDSAGSNRDDDGDEQDDDGGGNSDGGILVRPRTAAADSARPDFTAAVYEVVACTHCRVLFSAAALTVPCPATAAAAADAAPAAKGGPHAASDDCELDDRELTELEELPPVDAAALALESASGPTSPAACEPVAAALPLPLPLPLLYPRCPVAAAVGSALRGAGLHSFTRFAAAPADLRRRSEQLAQQLAARVHAPAHRCGTLASSGESFASNNSSSSSGSSSSAAPLPSTLALNRLPAATVLSSSGSAAATGAAAGGYDRGVKRAGFAKAFPVLFSRSWTNLIRQPDLFTARLWQIVAFGVMMTIFFWRVGHDQIGAQNRLGLVTFTLSMVPVGMLNAVAIFPPERNVFYREVTDSVYGTASFFVTYLSTELVSELMGVFAVAAVIIYGSGMDAAGSAQGYFIYSYVCFCLVFFGESLGMLFCALVYHVGFAVSLVTTSIATADIMAGFLCVNSNILLPLRYINYALPPRWAARVLAVLEFEGQSFYCTPEQVLSDGSCPITNGAQVLDLYEMSPAHWTTYLCALAAATIGFRIIALSVLHFHRPAVTASSA
jgi:ABC-type multidrug transport system ATPase subunit/ABC-type multidrug transport system permease subunit